MSLAARHRYSFRDYLAVEAISRVKHEYLDGEIYAMAGGSILHAALAVGVSSAFHQQLAGRCRVYSSDLRVRVAATGLTTYPDASIVCGDVESDPEDKDTVVNPFAVVEVLSPTTMDYDLGEKLESYQRIPSLRAVVLVWHDRRRIDIHERCPAGWRVAQAGRGERVRLEALACDLDVDALYDGAGAS